MTFCANQVIKRCHTVSLALQTKLPTAIFYSSEFLFTIHCHRYYSITTTEMKLLCASLIQFFFVSVSIHG